MPSLAEHYESVSAETLLQHLRRFVSYLEERSNLSPPVDPSELLVTYFQGKYLRLRLVSAEGITVTELSWSPASGPDPAAISSKPEGIRLQSLPDLFSTPLKSANESAD